jgi:hypothetical protein
MSNEPINNDDLATEEMLKMYESETASTPDVETLEALSDEPLDMNLADLPLDEIDDNPSLEEDILEVAETASADTAESDTTEESDNSIESPAATAPSGSMSGQLTAVVDNAMQALQDWMEVRHLGGDKGNPAQHLAQLDSLLDTVNQQQQSLASQLENAVRLNGSISGAAQTLGVNLPSPEALGWKDVDWQTRATAVSDKTDSIAAMNAKLRQQIASL